MNIKHILIILVFSMIGHSATSAVGRIRHSVVFRTYSADQPNKLEKLKGELRYYRGMKATGGVLTGTGVAFFVGGQAMFWSSVALNASGKRNYTSNYRDPLWIAGLGSTVLTAVPLAFGIPLLKFGTKKVKELKKQLPSKHLQ